MSNVHQIRSFEVFPWKLLLFHSSKHQCCPLFMWNITSFAPFAHSFVGTIMHASNLNDDNGVISDCLHNIKLNISGTVRYFGGSFLQVNGEVITCPLHILNAAPITTQHSLRLLIVHFCDFCPASHCRWL